MSMHISPRPPVLVMAGHDPSGAAGIQADIEAITACGGSCATLVTALTCQDTARFAAVHPQDTGDFSAQARMLMADQRFGACKIGLLGSAAIARTVSSLLPELGTIPVVLDPVLRSGSGTEVADDALIGILRSSLIGACTVITPNAAEARALAATDNADDAAAALLSLGTGAVLITGADEDTPGVTNTLYRPDAPPQRFQYRRLPEVFHGSGCTLSASLAAYLASGLAIEHAVRGALDFTWRSLSLGRRRGRGQLHPDRMAAGTTAQEK